MPRTARPSMAACGHLEPGGLRLPGWLLCGVPAEHSSVGCGGAHDVLLKDTTNSGNRN